ncbi:MAG: transposase [Candidatus Thiodiazotropha sp.]
MPNYKDSSSDQGVFISLVPSEQTTPGSFDETIHLLIGHVLDLSVFEAEYDNDHGGAPAYPPSALLKIILAAYYRGVTGSRKIENLCKYHTTFMALSGFLTPDHSTITAFISKSPERLESLFLQIVLECDYLGLTGGEVFAIDGSKISSNASKDWSGTKADFEKKYKKNTPRNSAYAETAPRRGSSPTGRWRGARARGKADREAQNDRRQTKAADRGNGR